MNAIFVLKIENDICAGEKAKHSRENSFRFIAGASTIL